MTWFIHYDEKILGPYSTEQVLKDLNNGDISYSAYIWAKGQVEWIPASEWEENLDSIVSPENQPDQLWKLRSKNSEKTNLTFKQVVETLTAVENLHYISVSPNDDNNWTPIYSSYNFMEALNMSRRSFLRAPLMGLAKVTKAGARFSYVVKTATVGQGGVGIYGLGPNFEQGTKVQIKIESEDLNTTILVDGTIVYNTDKGFIGIRFQDPSAEATAIIVEYIKKFKDSDNGCLQKAS